MVSKLSKRNYSVETNTATGKKLYSLITGKEDYGINNLTNS